MTSYIPAFITRRFSRSSPDPDNPIRLHASSSPVAPRHGQLINQEPGSREAGGNDALDRILAGEGENADALSPMSLSTPLEDDLRRIDQGRLAQVSNLVSPVEDHTRTRGTTDPLPRRAPRRAVGNDSHRGNRQLRLRASNLSLGGTIQNPTNPLAGAAGYIDDPSQMRSIRASVLNNMSMSPSTPGTPMIEPKAALMLPADDGMREMRDKIQAVQASDMSLAEKSRLVHILMTENYTAQHGRSYRELLRDTTSGRPKSPAGVSIGSIKSQDAPLTPKSEHSALMEELTGPNGDILASPSTSVFTTQSEAGCSLTSDDLRPSYYAKQPEADSSSGELPTKAGPEVLMGDEDLVASVIEDENPLGCAHYMRNVKLQCHACLRWYPCRFCHDEAEDHNLERRRTRNMLCMFCGTAQPAGPECRTCGEVAATYYCDVCKLWDNDPTKSIYHCDECGICRVGQGLGKDFFHCKVCDVCISLSIRDTHKCIERSVDCDCPICGEYMFTSPQTVVFMRCGHSIHHACYKQHLETSFKCPICAKSIMNMEMTFRSLDRAIAAQPMPEEFKDTRAFVVCNDCRGKSSVPYHWLGLKCGECDSYNTAQLQIIGPEERAAGAGEQAPLSGAPTPGLTSGMQSPYRNPRGRSENGNVSGRPRRPTSTSAIQEVRVPLGTDYFYPITNNGRSISAMGTDRVRADWGTDNNALDSVAADGEEEMDFWGGLSPRLRAVMMGGRGNTESEGEEDDSDSDDDVMHDPNDGFDDDDDDDDDDDEDGLMDDLEIFGHR